MQPQTLKALIVALVSIAGLGAVLGWLIFWSHKLALSAQDWRQKIAEQRQVIDQLSGLKRDKQRADELLPRLKLMLPDTERVLDISGEIETLAKNQGLPAPSFSFGNTFPATAEEPAAIGFSLASEGPLDAILGYIKALEALPYTVNLSDMELTRRDSRAYRLNAAGKIYTQAGL